MLSLDEMVSLSLAWAHSGGICTWHQWLRLSRGGPLESLPVGLELLVSGMCRISRSRKLKYASLGTALGYDRAPPCRHVVVGSSVIDELKS